MSGCEASIVLGGSIKLDVQNRLSQFVPPKTLTEVHALASVGDSAVPYLANDARHKPTIAAACVQALARIGSETALETLGSYSRDSREIIVDELLRAWDSFNGEDFARRVLLSGTYLSLDRDILLERVRLERIRYLTNLTKLDLSNSLDVNDLSWIEDLKELASLNLENCVQVSDLRPFSGLSNLVYLNLSGCTNVNDLRPLANLSKGAFGHSDVSRNCC